MDAKATSRDVARLAGVSQSCVSFILNNSSKASFSEETRERVFEAARALNYRLPEHKKSGQKPPKSLLVLIPTLANQYYAELGRAIESFVDTGETKVMVCSTFRKSELEKYYLDFFVGAGIGGIVYTFLPNFPEQVERINREIPVVLIGEKQDELSICSIELSNAKAASLLGEHLYSMGHRRFAFVSTRMDRMTLARRQRMEALRLMAESRGLSGDAVEVVSPSGDCEENEADNCSQPYEYTIGQSLTKSLLEKGCRATAFVGANDMIAIGVMRALTEAGYRIPEDFSVCGFDNIFMSSVVTPALTTIDHQLNMRCRLALDMIIARNRRDDAQTFAQASKIEYAPLLVARGSTGPAKKGG
ncbi:MAG: LacI family transcriptional regulator [Clostridiales bacterium]|jgi:LacI family transcriptional regulator|nr:LacI family transcriptional regulator [Clostridiales bacterium]